MQASTRTCLWLLVLCPALAMAAPEQDKQPQTGRGAHPHAAHVAPLAHGSASHSNVAGHRFEVDAPLKQGMRRMAAIVDALDHGRHSHLGPAQVKKLAQSVNDAAASMFAQCELAPEPDAALHQLLARLMAGANALDANPSDLAPLDAMEMAVADYTRLFDDPDFPR